MRNRAMNLSIPKLLANPKKPHSSRKSYIYINDQSYITMQSLSLDACALRSGTLCSGCRRPVDGVVGVPPPPGYGWILRVPYSVFRPKPGCGCGCCLLNISAALLRATCSYEGGGASSAMSSSLSVAPGASWGMLCRLLLSFALRGGDWREDDDTEGLRRRGVEPDAVD